MKYQIKELIQTRKYKPRSVRRVEIPKEDDGIRKLGVPTVLDRYIQQAITQVLTPIYEPIFSDSSYGFRPNRCCEMAIIKALEYMSDGFQWVVNIDIEKFFDTVSHDKLITLVMKYVKDGEIVSLIRKFLVSETKIDNEYQDSIILVGSGKATDRVKESVTQFIEKKLGLKVNLTKSKVSKPNDIKYLGFGFFKDMQDGLWKAKPHMISVTKLKEGLKRLGSRSWGVSMT